jgi:hypothetical protein
LRRDPDIVVRFVKQLETGPLTYLGLNQYAFSDSDFFLISEKTGSKTKIRFEQVGSRTCEIVCENATDIVPLLSTLINFTALKNGYAALPASAFSYKDVGVLVAGWNKGGATESLLAFAGHGSRYIGGNWILLSGDGTKMCGVPERIPLCDWHFKYLPNLRREVKQQDRFLSDVVGWLNALQRYLPRGRSGKFLPIRFLRDALPPLKRRLNVSLYPELIFDPPLGRLSACPDKIILSMSHATNDVRVEVADPLQIARHISASIQFQQLDFFKHYLAYKFAFPERDADFMERVSDLQHDILLSALAGKEAYTVAHPCTVSLQGLSAAMRPWLALTSLV